MELANPVFSAASGVASRNARVEPTVLFVGGEWGRKGLRLIGEAVAQLQAESGQQMKLQIVGRGSSATISRMRRELSIEIEHVAWSDDVSSFYAEADLLALASSYETFAMAGHEALGAGLPVLTTDVHGLGFAVASTKHGKVSPRNVKALAQGIADILDMTPTERSAELAASWIARHYGKLAIEQQRDVLRKHLSPRTDT
jgi:glycosyltransferase involved in cell wall biosynthesis